MNVACPNCEVGIDATTTEDEVSGVFELEFLKCDECYAAVTLCDGEITSWTDADGNRTSDFVVTGKEKLGIA